MQIIASKKQVEAKYKATKEGRVRCLPLSHWRHQEHDHDQADRETSITRELVTIIAMPLCAEIYDGSVYHLVPCLLGASAELTALSSNSTSAVMSTFTQQHEHKLVDHSQSMMTPPFAGGVQNGDQKVQLLGVEQYTLGVGNLGSPPSTIIYLFMHEQRTPCAGPVDGTC